MTSTSPNRAPAEDQDQEGGPNAVRFAFQVPRPVLRAMKQAALDRDITVSELLRQWIEQGLAGCFDRAQPPVPSRREPMVQFPVNLPAETRTALRLRCEQEDLRAAQLIRRWIAQALADCERERS